MFDSFMNNLIEVRNPDYEGEVEEEADEPDEIYAYF